jgi:hypothetical protein
VEILVILDYQINVIIDYDYGDVMMMEAKSLCRHLEQSSTQKEKLVTSGSTGCYTLKIPLTREILVSG